MLIKRRIFDYVWKFPRLYSGFVAMAKVLVSGVLIAWTHLEKMFQVLVGVAVTGTLGSAFDLESMKIAKGEIVSSEDLSCFK